MYWLLLIPVLYLVAPLPYWLYMRRMSQQHGLRPDRWPLYFENLKWPYYYRVTWRWWRAVYSVWRHPPKCHFCDAKAIGTYASRFGPVSVGYCRACAEAGRDPLENYARSQGLIA